MKRPSAAAGLNPNWERARAKIAAAEQPAARRAAPRKRAHSSSGGRGDEGGVVSAASSSSSSSSSVGGVSFAGASSSSAGKRVQSARAERERVSGASTLSASAGGFAAQRSPASAGRGGSASAAAASSASAPLADVVAIDCEMVGDYRDRDMLARVAVVGADGTQLLDWFVQPADRVVHYRTKYSGVTPESLRGAHSFESAARRVARLIEGKTVVGHGVANDLRVLMLAHPPSRIFDTSLVPEYRAAGGGRSRAQKLRVLAQSFLGVDIQDGPAGHSPVEDARAALALFHRLRK